LTLIETAIATIVALVLAAAVMSVGHAILSADRASASAWRGSELALGLLEEIASQPYDDPTLGETVIGPEAGEWPAANRQAFDDVDDYDVWDNQPIQTKDGVVIPIDARQSVEITWRKPNSLSVLSATSTSIKRIRVHVISTSGDTLSSVETLRAQGGRHVDLDF
jgi:hypothetical protein